MSLFHRLMCPIDHSMLEHKEASLLCQNGHNFDISKTGYVNLLPVQQKHSKDPGDSKDMVAARQRFLNTQSYEPIAESIAQKIKHILDNNNANIRTENFSFSLLDAGCGEGYYLSYLQHLYAEQLSDSVGLDISKWAVTLASKRNKKLTWIVGSNAHLPMPANRFEGIMCLFGFPVWSEFHRVLNHDGYIILANAGANHLLELRQILYPEIHPHTPIDYSNIEGFTLEQEETIQFQFELISNDSIMDLLSMTPHMYKASYEGRKVLEQTQRLSLTADVTLTYLSKIPIKESI